MGTARRYKAPGRFSCSFLNKHFLAWGEKKVKGSASPRRGQLRPPTGRLSLEPGGPAAESSCHSRPPRSAVTSQAAPRQRPRCGHRFPLPGLGGRKGRPEKPASGTPGGAVRPLRRGTTLDPRRRKGTPRAETPPASFSTVVKSGRSTHPAGRRWHRTDPRAPQPPPMLRAPEAQRLPQPGARPRPPPRPGDRPRAP